MEVSQEEWDAQILKCDDSFVEAMKLAKKISKIFINFKTKWIFVAERKGNLFRPKSTTS